MQRFEHGGDVYTHPGVVDFSASLNPLGMPAAARQALVNGVDAFMRYPDPACRELVSAIARFEGVDDAWVVPTAGATDAFSRICAVVRPRQALVCAPCYSGYEQALCQAGAGVAWHDLREDEGFRVTGRLARDIVAGTDVVFVASPNNPTGLCVPRHVVRACAQRAYEVGALLVLDECFVDLSDEEGMVGLLAECPGLVIVKALTKTYALAGLRVGYVLCADGGLASRLRDAGQPWAVSVPAQIAGVASLADVDHLAKSRRLVAAERERLGRALRTLGLRVLPSQANYLLLQGPEGLRERLLGQGILIRPCDNFRGLGPTWYRVAVRASQDNDLLVEVLEGVMA